MVGVQKCEQVQIRSTEPAAATEFYTDVLGMTVQRSGDGATHLGCGVSDRPDVVVRGGGTGIDAVRLRATDERLSTVETALADRDVATEAPSGEVDGIRFPLPSGVEIELVDVDPGGYRRVAAPAADDRAPGAVLDLDHVNLMSQDVEADARFLEAVAGFDLSDVAVADDDHWWAAWTRSGEYHHDIAIHETRDPDATLHHIALTVSDVGHLRTVIDAVVAAGIDIEVGIGRHRVGDNLFAYFWSPGGNRIELSTEMATLDDAVETTRNGPDEETFSAWGANQPPESFRSGS